MHETANERMVREIAREIALEAVKRIRVRLREAQAAPLAERLYEAEWDVEGREWPTAPMPAERWVPHLLNDLESAQAEFERCRR